MFAPSQDLEAFLTTVFWFKDDKEGYMRGGRVNIDISELDRDLFNELQGWVDGIEISLATNGMPDRPFGGYKIDVDPYLGLFPVEFGEDEIILNFDCLNRT